MRRNAFIMSLIAISLLLPGGVFAAYGDTSNFVSSIYPNESNPDDVFMDFPEGMTRDGSGNFFIADSQNNVIRKFDSVNNKVTTVAGTGSYGLVDGSTNASEFARPNDVARDSNGNFYVADTYNHRVRKIANGKVTTIIDGLTYPRNVLVVGNRLYTSDTNKGRIMYSDLDGKNRGILATGISSPTHIVQYGSDTLLVNEFGKHRILKVNRSNGNKSTLVGSGNLQNIYGMSLNGNTLYVAEDRTSTLDRIRTVNVLTGDVGTFFSEDFMATLRRVRDVEYYAGNIYAMSHENRIHRFPISDPYDSNEMIMGGDWFNDRNGPGSHTLVGRPYDMDFSSDNGTMYLAVNNKIRKINMSDKRSSHVIGRSVDHYIEGTDDNLASFSTITDVEVSPDDESLYVVDHWNNRIRKVSNITGGTPTASLVAGGGDTNCTESCNGYREGKGDYARFNNPTGMVVSGSKAYVTDTGNNRIRQIDLNTGQTSLVAGSGSAGYADGVGSSAKFNHPVGIAISSSGHALYVADQNNNRVRKIVLSTKSVTTLAGSGSGGYRDGIGTLAVLSLPSHIETGADGNLYMSEAGSHRIKFIDPDTASVRTISGSGNQGFLNGARFDTKFNDPKGIAVNTDGDKLYIADYWNDLLREISIPGDAPYFDPGPVVSSVVPQDRYVVAGSVADRKRIGIQGSGFSHGAIASIGGIDAISTYVITGNRVDIDFPFGQLPSGYYDVEVRNVDGQVGTLTGGFIVLNADGSLPPENIPPRPASTSFYGYENLRGNFMIASGNMTGDATDEIIQGTGPGLSPQIRLFDYEGSDRGTFFAFAETLKSGVRMSPCDLDGNGTEELVVSAGPPGRPHIRVLDNSGNMTISAGFFALDQKFQGGTNIACGDVNGNGEKEILVAASKGGGPHITVHRPDGSIIANFFAYHESFRGGVNIGTADFDDDGIDEIVTAPENGAPHVQMFKVLPGEIRRLNPGFYAFSQNFGGGLSIAGGDIDGDGETEFAVGQRTNGQAWVKVYGGDSSLIDEFLAYYGSFQGGVNVAMGDVDGDGKDEVITIPSEGGLPEIKVYDIDK